LNTNQPIFRPEKQYLIQRESLSSYLLRVFQFLYERGLKHVLILLVVIAYTLLGALLFYWLEADVDHSTRAIIKEVTFKLAPFVMLYLEN
jgi:hypothetical protein